jgi:phytoene dehydrogenase-like protein
VLIREANSVVGGAARTEELTLPGFRHDVGAAVFPLGRGSPFFASLPLEDHGLEWIHPDVPLAHPLDGGRAVLLHRSLERTATTLGEDARAYHRVLGPFVSRWSEFAADALASPVGMPRSPILMARFGLRGLRSAAGLARSFEEADARALLAGNAAHSALRLDAVPSAAIALTLMAAAHAVGWPVAQGGTGNLTRALASYFQSLGGVIETDSRVASLGELPSSRAVFLDVTRGQLAALARERLPASFRRQSHAWRYGPGAFKVDWALDRPIPWATAACARAATVHLGASFEEIAEGERAVWDGTVAERPFVLLAQPSLFDSSRAPPGKHTAWAYTHVPNGWRGDATDAIEAQVERFAPGFRAAVLARRTHSPSALETWDANLVGGDVNGGAATFGQVFGRTRWRINPWSAGIRDVYLCSASTPPGGGVHGMCGYHAARAALARTFRRR